MPVQRRSVQEHTDTGDTVVWIDDDQAVIGEDAVDGREGLQQIDRGPTESQSAFELRTVREIVDRDRLFVSGSAHARIGFERAYVALTHRPDRLVDGNRSAPPSPKINRKR